MATKVKFDVNGATARLTKKVKETLNDDSFMTEIGIFVTERIRFQARIGKPLNDDGKFPKLKPGTERRRASDAKYNSTHPAFSPDRSNLTFSGQLANAVSFKKLKAGLYEIFIKPSARAPIKTKAGKSIKSPNNQLVDDNVRELGFNLFTAKGLKNNKKIPGRIKQILLRFLRRKLR